MTIYVKDPKTDLAIRKLAKLRGTSLTEAIRVAVEKELEGERKSKLTIEDIVARFAAMPKSGLKADKDFYDSLYEE